MNEPQPDFRALRREWIVARAVLALGLVASAVVFAWLATHGSTPIASMGAASTANSGAADSDAAASDGDSKARRFCRSTVAVAQNFGTIPAAAKPDGSGPQRTDVRGRYVCVAQDGPDHYTVSVDLMCRDLGDERCFNLFNVSKSDGSVLFQRQS